MEPTTRTPRSRASTNVGETPRQPLGVLLAKESPPIGRTAPLGRERTSLPRPLSPGPRPDPHPVKSSAWTSRNLVGGVKYRGDPRSTITVQTAPCRSPLSERHQWKTGGCAKAQRCRMQAEACPDPFITLADRPETQGRRIRPISALDRHQMREAWYWLPCYSVRLGRREKRPAADLKPALRSAIAFPLTDVVVIPCSRAAEMAANRPELADAG